jgi:hypothetical protein
MNNSQDTQPSGEINNANPGLVSLVIDWYWEFGRKRTGGEALSAGLWLDQLYTIRSGLEKLARSERQTRATLALWGPSQTGKSTFLSRYIDGNGTPDGENTAIHWGSHKVRFSVGDKSEGVLCLNPYTFQADASGCISRFVLPQPGEVVNPDFPVRMRMPTPPQLLHALAAGYCSECRGEDEYGKLVRWNSASVTALLKTFQEGGTVSRPAFEFLHQVCDVFDLLRRSGWPRYRDITDSEWKTTRTEILNTSGLLTGPEKLLRFVSRLFWDELPNFAQAYRELSGMMQSLRKLAGGVGEPTLNCSFTVAAVLLDISSYTNLLKREGVPAWLGDSAEGLYYKVVPADLGKAGNLLLGEAALLGGNGGTPLLSSKAAFAHLQGVIWELIIPLREDIVKASPRLHAVLKKADLLDFPGVAKEHTVTPTALLDEAKFRDPAVAHEIFTRVLKRGKTSSIVVSSASDYDIDGFSILNKIMEFPGSPHQLVSGISVWWKSLLNREFAAAEAKDLPVNLVHTFFGNLVNDVLLNGASKLQVTLEKVRGLDRLAHPSVVTHFATNYAQFAPIKSKDVEDLDKALSFFRADAGYNRLFFNNDFFIPGEETENSCLSRMLKDGDGGTDYVLAKMERDAHESKRHVYLRERRRSLLEKWRACIMEALPPGGDAALQRTTHLNTWMENLRRRLECLQQENPVEDPALCVGYDVRRFLNVDAATLAPLPVKMSELQFFDVPRYVRKQLGQWQANAIKDTVWLDVGLTDEKHGRQIVEYLAEAVEVERIAKWMSRNFGAVRDQREGENARSFLAVRLSSAVLGDRPYNAPHPTADAGLIEALFTMAANEKAQATGRVHVVQPGQAQPLYERSPHFRAYLAHVFAHVEALKKRRLDSRGEQPGDREICLLIQNANGNGDQH